MDATLLLDACGEVIRELRVKAGLSQEDLAFACGIHRTYVSLIERGKNAPSITMLWTLAEGLDVSVSSIIRRVEKRLA